MNAPMQPDYRRRMEAAIAKAEDFEGRYETSHASRMHAEECWRQERARADAAEAREQALRDRVARQADDWEAEADRYDGQIAAGASTPELAKEYRNVAFNLRNDATALRALLSPPTADTEQSDQ